MSNLDCGIYQIKNKITGGIYIGQSYVLSDRKSRHFHSLRDNKHRNRFLQRSYNKYGYDNFDFRVLLYCEEFELTRYEQEVVDIYDPIFNICKECVESRRGVVGSSESIEKMIGHPVSEVTRKRISESLTGRPAWNKGSTGYTAWNKGLRMPKHSDEQNQKVSESLKGHAPWSKGTKRTEEQKVRLRGRVPWNKGIKTGNLPEETRRKMAISQKIRREREAIYDST